MSDEEINKLEAGIALDGLIAERVMGQVICAGWKSINFGSAGGPALEKTCTHADGVCYPATHSQTIYGRLGGPREYSTKIAAAWDVVERLRQRFTEVTCGYYSDYDETLERFVIERQTAFCCCEGGEDLITGRAPAEAMPLAICRAALMTLPTGAERTTNDSEQASTTAAAPVLT